MTRARYIVILPLLPLLCPAAVDTPPRLPLRFEANRGQAPASAYFIARSGPSTYLLESSRIRRWANDAPLGMSIEGARRNLIPRGEDLLPGAISYFPAAGKAAIRHVPSYRAVRYADIYPGIDMLVYGGPEGLEYDFLVRPGADPSRIRLGMEGPGSLSIDASGTLLLRTAQGEWRHRHPVIHQQRGSRTTPLPGRFVLLSERVVGFRVDHYDRSLPLTIDPVISFSSFYGGSARDVIQGMALDKAGYIYVTGTTDSADLPANNGHYQGGDFPGDVFVAKFNPQGTALIYAAYVGGSRGDFAYDIAVDGFGNAYVAGVTESSDFPVTANAMFRQYNGRKNDFAGDGFLFKIDSAGTSLVYATYLGSEGADRIYAVAVDAGGNAYVAGESDSGNFPTTAGAVRRNPCGGTGSDGVAAKVNPNGSAFVYSTFLCGSGLDRASSISVDRLGNAYVTGSTGSSDFPVTPGAPQGRLRGSSDAFVVKLSQDGASILYATYLGGSGADSGESIFAEASGLATIAGNTFSLDFPATGAAFQRTHASGGFSSDAFLARLNFEGNALLFSTYFGGEASDRAARVVVDSSGAAILAGSTRSAALPGAGAPCVSGYAGGEDAFVTKFNPSGSQLLFTLQLGGFDDDRALALAAGSAGSIFLAGHAGSSNFLTTAGAFRNNYALGYSGGSDGFLARVDNLPLPAPPCIANNGIVNGASFLPGPVAPGEIVSIFGAGLGPANPATARLSPDGRFLATSLAGTSVLFDGVPAPLIFAAFSQVSAVVPYRVAARQATRIEVEFGGRRTPPVTIPVMASVPAIFTAGSSGRGAGAVLNEDFSLNTPSNPAARGSIVQIFATGGGLTTPDSVDGQLAIAPLPRPRLPVSVRIGGSPAQLTYAGAAPGLVAGVLQVNARVPADIRPNAATPVVLRVGDQESNAVVTIAVR